MDRLRFPRTLLEWETARAVLLRMPMSSEYRGYSFWFPDSLVSGGSGENAPLVLSVPTGFRFRLRRRDGTEKEIGFEAMADSLPAGWAIPHMAPHVPEEIAPRKATVPEELLDD